MIQPIRFRVLEADVTDVPSDLLLLKYAQQRYGADLHVAKVLVDRQLCEESEISPRPDDFAIVETKGCIAPSRVMFLGTSRLDDFGYGAIKDFAECAARILILGALPIRHVTTTLHGVGYGLDAEESLRNLAVGVLSAALNNRTGMLERVTIVEIRTARARYLADSLKANIREWEEIALAADPPMVSELTEIETQSTEHRVGSERSTTEKEHVFVAMPFSDEFEDVYEFGIYAPVRQCGFICEHVGQAAFTGDVLDRIRERIRTAKLMIADLTGARPNVYLEVGYAWGCGVPVIILAKKGEDLHFDVSTHRCIYYRNITHLAKEVKQLIRGL